MTITTYKWSVEEYHLMIESGLLAGKAVELLNGEIVEMSPEREEDSYTKITEYTQGTISPLAFPELEIALKQLLLF